MKYSIAEFAKLSGVSVRTLHYYDEIGLLAPEGVKSENGYRYYGEKEMLRMQEILFYRELDFSLCDIKNILSSSNYDKKAVLNEQKNLLLLKKERLEKIIMALEALEKGEGEGIADMSIFSSEDFEKAKNEYREEAERRFGETEAYREHREKTKDYSSEKWNDVGIGINKIMSEFAEVKKGGTKASSEEALSLVAKLQKFITDTQYTCTKEVLLCLGEMYVGDERFKANIDKNGEGTAEFINCAIITYCKR